MESKIVPPERKEEQPVQVETQTEAKEERPIQEQTQPETKEEQLIDNTNKEHKILKTIFEIRRELKTFFLKC